VNGISDGRARRAKFKKIAIAKTVGDRREESENRKQKTEGVFAGEDA
jgi:hypothetical protein